MSSRLIKMMVCRLWRVNRIDTGELSDNTQELSPVFPGQDPTGPWMSTAEPAPFTQTISFTIRSRFAPILLVVPTTPSAVPESMLLKLSLSHFHNGDGGWYHLRAVPKHALLSNFNGLKSSKYWLVFSEGPSGWLSWTYINIFIHFWTSLQLRNSMNYIYFIERTSHGIPFTSQNVTSAIQCFFGLSKSQFGFPLIYNIGEGYQPENYWSYGI